MIGKNNPFNVRYVKANQWKGLTGSTKGFCDFCDIRYGVRTAAYILMRTYRKHGVVTYADIIKRYAPSIENNTDAYIQYVCDNLHVFPFDECKTLSNYCGLLHYMWIMESGKQSAISALHIREILNQFNLKPYEKK